MRRALPPGVRDAVHALRNLLPDLPEVVVVLGSGLAHLEEVVERRVVIPFREVPGFPPTSVEGHPGRYVFGLLQGRRVLVQAGRFHLYEGHPSHVVSLPVRIAHAVGAGALVLTNTAGAVDRGLEPGPIMLVDDHVNLQWGSPLSGPVYEGEGRFPDMSSPYDADLQALALAAARDLRIPLVRGTYGAVPGPSYETPAEARMLEGLGVHAVGMSTVPEVIVARALGLRVAAFSLITNRAAGGVGVPLSHADVMDVARSAGADLGRLLGHLIRDLPR